MTKEEDKTFRQYIMIGGFMLTVLAAIAAYSGTAIGVGELKSRLESSTGNNANAVAELETDVRQLKINDANCERRLSVIDNNISNLKGQGVEIGKIQDKQIGLAIEFGRMQATFDSKFEGFNTRFESMEMKVDGLKNEIQTDLRELGKKIDRNESH